MMGMKIIFAGPLSTVQDKGRFGYQKSGIGTSGVMDHEAYETANYLVGNEHGEAVIEATLFGLTIQFDEDCICAVTGADMGIKLDEVPVEMYQPFRIMAGQTLSMGMAVNGCRSYIAFMGGIDVPVIMNSRSTNLKCHFGGYEGRALKNGDELKIGKNVVSDEAVAKILTRKAKKVHYDTDVKLRVVEGPQEDYFTEKGKKTFYGNSYEISVDSDRMGFRLDGPEIENVNGVDIVSDGIALGAIQVPSGGKPIILLADRQTTGGYAKIGTVCRADLSKLVQLKPKDKVRFVKISVEEAQKL